MIMNIIKDYIQHLKNFDNTYVAHKYREANQVADNLANWALKNNEVVKWMNGHTFPSKILEMIERERILSRLGIIKGTL